ncbi:MAG TPA: hypothetical protein VE780_01475 [Thermoleophilaceae bacterium]|nr:hypothetical protein [Thermoleophilaceae bacterium]
MAAGAEVRRELVEQPGNAVALDLLDGLPVDAGRATVAHLPPRPLQDVPAVDLVVERVEASPGIGLGRPVERSLQFSGPVFRGGNSHAGHSPNLSLHVTPIAACAAWRRKRSEEVRMSPSSWMSLNASTTLSATIAGSPGASSGLMPISGASKSR